MEYVIHLLILIGIYLILAQSFNVPFGLGRLFNLAHVAAYSIGAYTTALLSTELGVGVWQCLIASVALSGLFSLLIGGIALRLQSDYFAIGTLAFALFVQALLINWKSLTRGVLGIPGIPRPEIGGANMYENSSFLLFTFGCVLVFLVLVRLFVWGRLSRALRAGGEFESAAMALGLPVRLHRNLSFVVASGGAGLAGAIFAYYISYIDPSSFSFTEMVFVLTMVVVGKPGSFWGCLAGTTFLVLLPEPFRFFDLPPSILGPMRQLLYALTLFAVVWWKRFELFPHQRRL